MSLLLPRQDTVKQPRVFVGEGFPTIPKRLYEKILRWEFVDFDLRAPVSAATLNTDVDFQKLIVLPGLEYQKPRRRQSRTFGFGCNALHCMWPSWPESFQTQFQT